MRFSLSLWTRVLLATGLLANAPARAEWGGPVEDLAYGEALFQLYQQQYFTGLVHLSAEQTRGRIPHHTADARLALAGMYLSYGMSDAAMRALNEVGEAPLPPEATGRGWFFLAKVLRSRAEPQAALAALTRVTVPLEKGLEPERVALQASVLQELQHDDKAMALLRDMKENAWSPYARYNHAVALLNDGDTDGALALLNELAGRVGEDEETQALRDRSHVLLGNLVREKDPLTAIDHLSKVRLHGPYAERALLGLGQAYSATRQPQLALITWNELQTRLDTNASVQQAWLVIGHAHEARGASAEALAQYQSAIAQFEFHLKRLDDASQTIASGAFLDHLIAATPGTEMGWYWRPAQLSADPELAYLAELIATNEFQEGIKTLRDLRLLDANLARWSTDIASFDIMLTTRVHAYRERLPVVQAGYERATAPDLRARYQTLKDEIDEIERSGRGRPLANAHEKDLFARMDSLQKAIDRMSADDVPPAQREKLRIARGVLEWNLETTFHARLYQVKKQLHEVEQALAETDLRQAALLRTQADAPKDFTGFAQRINDNRRQIQLLRPRILRLADEQRSHLLIMAEAEIERRRGELRTLLSQARFDTARLTDRLARAAAPEEMR